VNHSIRKITPSGTVSTFAGTPGVGGSTDGVGSTARFYLPYGIAVDSSGNIYVADTGNQLIRKITPNGNVTTFAGSAGISAAIDGVGSSARFKFVQAITIDSIGNLFVADSGNHLIRRITPNGNVTTIAGTAESPGSSDGIGSAARFNIQIGIAFDSIGSFYIADNSNHIIRKLTLGCIYSSHGNQTCL
jgi:sugar lactone lactonase YvrE